MRALLVAPLLAAAPAALAAQHHPTPGDTARRLPDMRPPGLIPQASSRGAGTLAGAAAGAVLGAGALRGGVRGLFGLRGRRGPVRTGLPDTGRDPAPPAPPAGRTGCEALDPAPGTSR